MRYRVSALLAAIALPHLSAQWEIQPSGTTGGLRGVHHAGGGVAWASGTGGTVLRTTDGGAHWTTCAVPDARRDGASLDFRAVHAWDARTAIVMSAGPGPLSRLYRTTDGCKSWKRVLQNRDKEGFWDALRFEDARRGWLIGDPVGGRFALFATSDGGRSWHRQKNAGLASDPPRQAIFAASNSSLGVLRGDPFFATGGTGGAHHYAVRNTEVCVDDCPSDLDGSEDSWVRDQVPVGESTETSGVFSIAARLALGELLTNAVWIAVGGDYKRPDESANTAAFRRGAEPWAQAAVPPGGYRSSVQWSRELNAWITVGPNGTDISSDDGRTWRALKPSPGDPPDSDRNWNALSLPFVVGPNGRIGKLRGSPIHAAACCTIRGQ